VVRRSSRGIGVHGLDHLCVQRTCEGRTRKGMAFTGPCPTRVRASRVTAARRGTGQAAAGQMTCVPIRHLATTSPVGMVSVSSAEQTGD
jgi:hypothetical protein